VTPALGTPSSGTLTNCTGLPEAGLVDDAVTLAKMAAGTAGNLITYDASGNPAAVATGTATHVLTSNGAGAAPTFQAAAGGGGSGWTLIGEGTVDSVASVTEDSVFSATYDEYELIFINLKTDSDTTPVYLRLRVSGADVTDTYTTVWDGRNQGSGNVGGITGVASGWVLNGTSGTDTNESGSGNIQLWPRSGGEQRQLHRIAARYHDTNFAIYQGAGAIAGYTTNVDGFKLYVPGGNMDGTWRLFGR
jgi:hypothetical protein